MKLLIKYPTRERPKQFAKTLHAYRTMLDDIPNTRILVTVDADDRTMFSARDLKWPDTGEPIEIGIHHGRGKIKAINHGVPADGWDILLLASDDMMPQLHGYDNAIRLAFGSYFPDTDGALWIADGRQDRICTIVCVGRKYYERDEYLYHPSYKSLWCDNEWTEVAEARGKLVKLPSIIRNESPDWGGNQKNDELYRRNNRYYPVDERNYMRRKAAGFPP